MNRPALAAGGGIVSMAVLAGIVGVAGPTGLLTGHDPDATVRDILASPDTFRLSVTALVLVAVLDVVVAWGLFELFAPGNPGLARLAAWSRLAYAAIFMVAVSQLVGANTSAALADFRAVWQVALVLFGLHLVLVGRLAYTSRLVPRPVAVLVAVSGLGYLADSFGFLLVRDYDISVGAFTFVGELLLGLWLLAGARGHVPAADDGSAGQVNGRVPTPNPL